VARRAFCQSYVTRYGRVLHKKSRRCLHLQTWGRVSKQCLICVNYPPLPLAL